MWLFEQTLVASQTGINNIIHDGRDVWVSAGNQIKVYSYIDEEYLAHEFQFDRGMFELKLVATIDHGTATNAMVSYDDKVYVMSGVELKSYDKTTYTAVGSTIALPVPMQYNMCVANNKIWFVTYDSDHGSMPGGVPTSDCQGLYYYDLLTSTWSAPVLIPGKKQFIVRSIVDGYDGHIYITCLNDHAIAKFTTSGSYVGQYRINRHPYLLHANQYQQVYIASDVQEDPLKGMVSVFNTSTNTFANFAASGGSLLYLADDAVVSGDPEDPTTLRASALTTGKLHYLGGGSAIAQLNKADKHFKFKQDPASEVFVPGAALMFDAGTVLGGVVTPPLTFEVWNGSSFVTKTVKPYAFVYNATTLYAVRLSSLVRVNSMDVLGTAMIATGAQNYYGDL